MTEPKRHPWADVLIAIAEGREVQFRSIESDCLWGDFYPYHHSWPGVNERFEWRVKPQKLKRWLNVYERNVHDYESREQAGADALSDRIACIEIKFEDGEGL